ncbi:MAG TPA: NAD(P)H-dependent oxidoreductase subunit E [Anaeromyxobacteraceae bacterium]|nr:NAD(P)H-dependent oxidoreductase subunit E [Anaeromyxobacteraceae bacterium]
MSHHDQAAAERAPQDIAELPKDLVARFDAGIPAILARYPSDHQEAAMLPALRLAQEIFGWLPPAAQKLAADRIGAPAIRADEVATFYVMYHTRPVGRHVVEVCTNVSCSLTGGFDIYEHLKKRLGVENGGTTADGRITLRQVECLGSCATAPAMLVDEEMHERLTVEAVDRILGGLK